MATPTIDRIRRSVKLTDDQYKALVQWVEKQLTKLDAAILLDMSRQALDRILAMHSGSPKSITKILDVLRDDASRGGNGSGKKLAQETAKNPIMQ